MGGLLPFTPSSDTAILLNMGGLLSLAVPIVHRLSLLRCPEACCAGSKKELGGACAARPQDIIIMTLASLQAKYWSGFSVIIIRAFSPGKVLEWSLDIIMIII